jgi:hypothetical protein
MNIMGVTVINRVEGDSSSATFLFSESSVCINMLYTSMCYKMEAINL